MVPDLARRTAQGDRRAAGGFLNRVLSATSLLMAPAMALLTVIGPSVGRVLFKEETVGDFIFWLAIGTLLTCYQSVLSGALNGLGLQGRGARNAIVSDVVQLAFTWFTVPIWGLPGFVAGYVLSALVGMGMNLISVLRATHLRAQPFHWFVRPLLAAVLMGLWCNLFFKVLKGANYSGGMACLLCTLLGVALYVAALLAQGISVTQYLPKGKKRA
jgi:O-antigen/teichoic acid export membrane protein